GRPAWLAELKVYFLPGVFLIAAIVCFLPTLTRSGWEGRETQPAAMMLAFVGVTLFALQWLPHWQATWKNRRGETRLMRAAEQGQAARVTTWLARGAEVNEKDRRGQTALMKAAANGHTAIVRLLLARGAEVSEKDHEGQTALTMAAANHHEEIVALLKKAG